MHINMNWLLALCFIFALTLSRSLALPPQLDLRLSKGFGSRGYNSVRVSSINNDVDSVVPDEFFTYAAPFQHRWTNFTLRTTVLDGVPSGDTPVATPLGEFTMRLPQQGAGIRGLIMGDPCFINGSFHPCTCGTTPLTASRTLSFCDDLTRHAHRPAAQRRCAVF